MGLQSKNLTDILTFTRASGGTSFRPVGRGTLVNQLAWSRDFTNAAWGKLAGGTATLPVVTPNAAVAPDGMPAALVVLNKGAGATSSDSCRLISSVGPTPVGSVWTHAHWLKTSDGTTRLISIRDDFAGITGEVLTVTPSWQLFVFSGTSGNASQTNIGLWLRGTVGTSDYASVHYAAAGVFQGAYTAQQILDNGGIPLTFASADNLLRLDAPGDPIQLFTAPANVPRMDYDPVTRQCKGLLIEEQRTNLLLWSSNFANAAWTKAGCTVAVSSVLAPDGSPMTLLTENTTTGAHYVLQSVVSGTGRATQSWYVKPNGRTRIQVRSENPQTNQLTASFLLTGNGSVTAGAGTISLLENGIYFVTVASSGNGTGASGYHLIQTLDAAGAESYTGDNTSGIYIWGAQLEAGAFATSHVPTTGAAATRAAEGPVVNTLAPWYNAAEGTLLMDVGSSRGTTAQYATAASLVGSVTGVNYVVASFNALGTSTLITGGSTLVQPAVVSGQVAKVALGLSPTSQSMVVNGGAVVTRAVTAPLDQMTALRIGYWEANPGQLNGHVTRIRYIPKRLSDAKLQALTTLSYGAPYGVERVTNGDFSNGSTGWTLDAGISVGAGKLNFNTADATPFALNLGTVEAGKMYEATFFMSGFVSGGVSLANNGASFGAVFSADGLCKQTVAATQTGQLAVRARLGATVASIDNISIREASLIL